MCNLGGKKKNVRVIEVSELVTETEQQGGKWGRPSASDFIHPSNVLSAD